MPEPRPLTQMALQRMNTQTLKNTANHIILGHIVEQAKQHSRKQLSNRIKRKVMNSPHKFGIHYGRALQNHPCYNPKKSQLTKPAIIRCININLGIINRDQQLSEFTRLVLANLNDPTLTPAQMEKIMMVFTKDQLMTFLSSQTHGNLQR